MDNKLIIPFDKPTFYHFSLYFDEEFEQFFDNTKFLNPCDRIKSILELREKEKGSFLVRKKYDSPRKPYVISVKIDDQFINHLWIRVSRKPPTTTWEKLTLNNTCSSNLTISTSSLQNNTNSTNYDYLIGKTPLPIDYSFHIDFGEQTFPNVITLLQYYTNNNLGDLFANCDTCLKPFLNKTDKINNSPSNFENSDDSGLNISESDINPLRRALPNSVKERTDDLDVKIDSSRQTITFKNTDDYQNNESDENLITIKYAYKTSVKHNFNRSDFEEISQNLSIPEQLFINQEIYVIEESKDNWIKAVIIDSKVVQYVPKNFLHVKSS